MLRLLATLLMLPCSLTRARLGDIRLRVEGGVELAVLLEGVVVAENGLLLPFGGGETCGRERCV